MTVKEFATILFEPGFPNSESEPVYALTLDVFIDEPDPNEDVTSPVVVTGRVTCTGQLFMPPAPPGQPFDAIGTVQNVQVRFGNGSFETATTSDGWRHWSISRSRSQGTTSVTARATAQITNLPSPPGTVLTETDEVTVNNVFVDTTAPSLTVNTPQDATVGPPYQIAISGSASDNRSVKVVRWRLGNGSFKTAATHNSSWSSWSDTVTLTTLGSREVTVQAEDQAGNTRTRTVTVRAIDITQPNLVITEPHPNDVFTLLGESITVRMEGQTSDAQSGIQTVRWRRPGGAFTQAIPVAANNWSSWHADVVISEAGVHQIEIEAVDTANQIASATVDINVAEPFESDDPLEVVSPAAYLEDLLTFATFRIKHQGTGQSIDRANLEAAFKQPFTLLTTKDFRQNAVRPVAQARLGIEVLRQYLAANGRSLSAETEQAYRRAAYTTLLHQLGTSFDELRFTRAADDSTRAALADRLGVTLGENRPDIVDAITLDPNTITETDLENLFGLPDTSRDPASLSAPSARPFIDVARQNHMRQRWLDQDGARQSDFDAGRPIIDPDRVFETDFMDATPGDPAYNLWLERQAWITAAIDNLRGLRDDADTPLAGLQAIFAHAFGTGAAVQTLYAAHLAGEDIRLQLHALRLTRAGFLTLGRFQALLLADAPVLEEEWDRSFSVVMQAAKIGQYDTWQAEEQMAGITLSPDFFQPAPAATLAPFRATETARRDWELTLRARVEQAVALQQMTLATVQETEAAVLPILREALVAKSAEPVTDNTNLDDIANRLSHELGIDVRASGNQQTTRIHQGIETIQEALFSLRTGRFQNLEPVSGSSPAAGWTFKDGYSEADFDEEWRWMGAHITWRTAMLVFGYPENYLLPNLRPAQTNAFRTLVAAVHNQPRLTPTMARDLINGNSNTSYLRALDEEIVGSLPVQSISDQFTNEEVTAWHLANRQAFVNPNGTLKYDSPHEAPHHIQEIFFAVPLLIGLQLQKAGHYLAALDWFQLVYAYEQSIEARKVYYGLVQEGDIETIYQRVRASWLLQGMNPHSVVHARRNAMTQFTLMSLVRCFLDFADSEFTQDTRASRARARSLYLATLDLLDLPEMQLPLDENGEPDGPFPPNPLLASLHAHATLNLAKLRNGRNIAGLEQQLALENVTAGNLLPTISANGQINTSHSIPRRATLYRYSVLIDRAKQLTNIAQQVEVALLAAIEKRDNEEYHLLKARQDLQLTDAAVQFQMMRVTEAANSVTLAELQRDRSRMQRDHFDQMLEIGTSQLEQEMLGAMSDSLKYQRLATAFSDFNTMFSALSFAANPASALFGNPFANAVQSLSARAQEASTVASIRQTRASFERREQEWRAQSQLSRQDVLIGEQQISLAQNHITVVQQEQFIAEIQSGHAAETLNFLANKFTNAELYEWMSQILLRAYSYFLQQATAMAKLAERQLAFERLEALPAFIRADYWQPPAEAGIAGVTATSDRLGLTGSTQLQQDIIKLDQYAFETKQRKLQLAQTFSLSQLSPAEFQQFRESGVLQFYTPMGQFDRAFPGHFMRLIKKVRVSLLALVPPVDGLRATLTSSGISRVVIGNDTFQMITVQRDPEQIAFTAPTNATGLLDLEPESEMLLPFEGMGVDGAWELQLPKAANQFDFRTIADVLFTIEYTALSSIPYRQRVVQQFDRTASADRMFNFRDTFADQWFDLYNRDQSASPMVVRFDIRRADFPPNLSDVQIQHVLLYFVRQDGINIEVPVRHLHLTPANETGVLGGGALTVAGRVSTRSSNGQAWAEMIGASPVGPWELALDGTLEDGRPVAALFDEEAIEDILLVLTYTGQTPAWIP